MNLWKKEKWRFLGFVSMALILCITLACINRPMKNAPPLPIIASVMSIPQSAERDIDLLFIIDNSGSMAEEQLLLTQQFSALMAELKNITGGLPNVHIGVTSSDLGTNPFPITYCMEPGGDRGNLLTGNCANPTGAPFIVDVEPQACEVTKNEAGICSAHNCSQANCESDVTTSFAVDGATGCPRCRNYTGEQLEDVFSCIASLGIEGCGFEQHLEAMYKALEPSNAHNRHFIREDAFLAVVFIADEDDCSASNPQLFDNTQNSMDSQLGPLTSYRCTEFGITSDQGHPRAVQGVRTNVRSRDDPGALLHPVSRYINFLQGLKDPQMLVIAGILGPVINNQITIGLDEYGQPKLMPSCSSVHGDAEPAVRIREVIMAFNEEADMSWAMTSICSPTYTDALTGIGKKIGDLLDVQCLPQPLKSCADPGAEFGMPRDDYAGNDVCLATCNVVDIFERGLPGETRQNVPPCLEVCPSGLCPGNKDRSLSYANGHPLMRDANLPVSACWHINAQPLCEQSNWAEIIVSRREDPPSRSFAEVGCVHISQTEQICNDGIDNDEDGLIDMDDPDCWI